ncbi:hypothetical protein PAXRUDRAFT_821059 [Paxillus rubicundulus Ve08.2h10]|uniref:Uncharacterized protein n=1 Tax=Paxillus rubicundulus Ve08.2h10 TaxID=930991 RepID=A0A0D0EDF8_9AGAM|nr:hypothetical protein PAXRUDRAFT_821059 [Paxillus rubicundulus Ve08.2h10]
MADMNSAVILAEKHDFTGDFLELSQEYGTRRILMTWYERLDLGSTRSMPCALFHCQFPVQAPVIHFA